ncbi:hypothetical protein [Nocardia sp. NPDC050406]|uniref:hypothetical protein n=1 Tax=Nocardia sp. NPDC050406 TaxID=3364318 RepID=UPI003791DB6F
MRRMSRRVGYALPAAVAASLIATGCGGSNAPRVPKTAPVSSTAPRTTAPTVSSTPKTTAPKSTTAVSPPTTTQRGGLGGGSGGGGS